MKNQALLLAAVAVLSLSACDPSKIKKEASYPTRQPGSDKILVNGREQEVYFARPTLRLVINQPFGITERVGQYDVIATVKGGGLSGQAGAVLHGIAQALSRYEPALRTTVKRAGFLTRDSRVVERKKYGRAKARRSFQFSKR